jgi:predicted aspartyl protease
MRILSFALSVSLSVLPLEAQDSNDPRKSGLPETKESVTIDLSPTFAGLTANVEIDGMPVKLVVDTGAPVTTLSPETAKKIGLKVTTSSVRVFSISGERIESHVARTKRINLAGAWTTNEQVMIGKLPQGFADGALGISTLADWDVRIDPAANKLTLFPAGRAPKLARETVLPLTCEQVVFKGFELSVPVRIGKHVLAAHPDTGFGGTFQLPRVSTDRFAPEVMAEALPALVTAFDLSGKVETRAAKFPDFTFGPDSFRGLPANIVEIPPGRSPDDYVFLGLNILRHYILTYSFSSKELRLKPLGTAQEVTRASTAGLNLGVEGEGKVVVVSVDPDGPGAQVGLRAGDELLEIERHALKTMKPAELSAFKQFAPGTSVKITYRRGNSDPVEVTLVLGKS